MNAGTMGWLGGALVLLAVLGCDSLSKGSGKGAPGGSAKPTIAKRCSPDHTLTDEERYLLQQETDEGKDPCPGWALPRIVIDAQGLRLNTEPIDGGSYAMGHVMYIKPLFEKLKKNRETWKSLHPNKSFPGKLSLVAEPTVGTGVGASVMVTAAYAGYPHLTVEAGKVAVKLRWRIPGAPADRDQALVDEVFVEPLADKGFQVALRSLDPAGGWWSSRVRSLARPADEGALKRWFEQHCQPDETVPPVKLLRLRALDGPLIDALRVLRTVLALPVFANGPPDVQLTFQCEPVAPLAGQPGAHPQWGPRFPMSGQCHLLAAPEDAGGLSPRTRAGKASISGKLPPEVIQRIVRQSFGRFRLCYEDGLRSDPKLEGRVAVKFEIAEDGTVQDVEGGGDLPDPQVIACVSKAFYSLTFPPPQGGSVTVSYPIVFTPGG